MRIKKSNILFWICVVERAAEENEDSDDDENQEDEEYAEGEMRKSTLC